MRFLVVGALLAVAQPAQAQAVFGLRMGMQPSALPAAKERATNAYTVQVPQPQPDFDFYMVTAPPRIGLCRILAIGRTYKGPDAERHVLATFDRVKAAVEKDYGAGELMSRREQDGRSWAEQLRADNGTFHSAYWPKGLSYTNYGISPDIRSISMDVKALSTGELYVLLRYEFSNVLECRALEKGSG